MYIFNVIISVVFSILIDIGLVKGYEFLRKKYSLEQEKINKFYLFAFPIATIINAFYCYKQYDFLNYFKMYFLFGFLTMLIYLNIKIIRNRTIETGSKISDSYTNLKGAWKEQRENKNKTEE